MVWSLLDVLEHSSECSLAPQHGHRNVTFVLKKNSGSTPKQMDRLRPVFVSFEVKGEKESDDDDQRCVVKAGGRKAGRQVDGGGGSTQTDRSAAAGRSSVSKAWCDLILLECAQQEVRHHGQEAEETSANATDSTGLFNIRTNSKVNS